MRFRLLFLALLAPVVLLTSVVAGATTIIPAADPGELALESHAVFLGKAGASRVQVRSGHLTTVTDLVVLSVVKGGMTPGDVVEVVVPGGEQNGVAWAVAGSPRLVGGEVYLLFADRGRGGLWQPRLLADSVLQRAKASDGSTVLVAVPESMHIERLAGFGPKRALIPMPVDEDLFLEALERRIDGKTGWSWDEVVDPAGPWSDSLKVAPTGCVFMTYDDGDGNAIRWRRFDSGGSLTMNAETGTPSDVEDLIENALDRWNEISGTSLDLRYGGAIAQPPARCDDEETDLTANAIIFDDPCDEIARLNNCSGTLAFGGPSFYLSTHTFDDLQWHEAAAWFMIVNEGTAECLSELTYEQMFAHEMGHGLGFGHVADSSAMMHANCCNDHNDLDIDCTQYLYPVGGTPPTPTPTPTPGSGGQPDVTVPVIVHVDGSGGTAWRSDVLVANGNPRIQQLQLTYTDEDQKSLSVVRTLPRFATLLLEDLIQSVFEAGDGKGPLGIDVLTAGTSLPVVVSRAYSENTFGNLGSGLPADVEPSSDAVTMPGLFHDGSFRSNIAVTAAGEDVTASIDLYRGAEGLVVEGATRKIEAGTQKQWPLHQLFNGWALDGVPMTVRVSLSAPGLVHASMIDNASTDSAVFLGKEASTTWVVPVVAHLQGAEDTFWSSSVALWNSASTTTTVDLEYLPEKNDNSAGGLFAATVSLEADGTKYLDDVVLSQFGITNGKGVLIVKGSQPITVTSRVFTDCDVCPLQGTSGNGVRTVPVASVQAGTAVLPGVRMANGFRTNVGFVTGDRGTTFNCTLYDGDGSVRSQGTVTVPARSLEQRSVQKIFGPSAFVDPVGMVTVESDDPFLTYMTIIDGSSQDPVFVMPQ